ncbi:hypothetical protein GDO81_003290 [Engystomops pustulosus]|uniref:Uncharacterized protein n=1 Tax=Engystomops pustulosus TaxID=76066 RepID=A0AAV6ZVF9_ENGPU|nr:hypothetical protein GDO81_003290 [Engystomops pustulosus]
MELKPNSRTPNTLARSRVSPSLDSSGANQLCSLIQKEHHSSPTTVQCSLYGVSSYRFSVFLVFHRIFWCHKRQFGSRMKVGAGGSAPTDQRRQVTLNWHLAVSVSCWQNKQR